MKKILLSFLTIISLTVFAQSSLSIEPSESYYAEVGEQCVAHFDVTNTTDAEISVIVTRSFDSSYDIMSTFCWGITCYPPTVDVSSQSILIPAGESFDGFSGYINDMPEDKTFIINYCFSVVDNPSDKVCADVEFTSISTVGVEETNISFGVYPNPANDVLHLEYTAQQAADFVLYDMLGNKIYSDVVLNSKSIQLNAFEAGIYFYTFSVNGKNKEVQKLIISH
tara:strand:- start:6377 stop:7048 length:672 start_codon:yes stop_codon:yes gene_type:complete